MGAEYPKFEVDHTDSLEPNDKKSADIYSRLGYKISDAAADLVDNSLDATAANVLIRFVRTTEGIHSVIIADDGHGMDAQGLKEAMRFGSDVKTNSKQLGKYGIGLKSASLSQADVVTVLSRKGKSFVGRRWSLENIKDKWKCEILRESGVRDAFKIDCGQFKIAPSGTIVIWERLEHLRALPNNLDKVMETTIEEISVELGIRFHRFLETKSVKIAIDQQFAGEGVPEAQRNITPLNPFSYTASGHPDYPVTLKLDINGTRVDAKCHIWPPKSNSPGYRLGGGKVALRQGFYFYRNDRVIQAGGWNRLRADDGEPHLSLARVEINLPASLDSMFKLDVTKSHLDPSPQFVQALQRVPSSGISFSKYLETADAVYRRQKKREAAKFPFVPGGGIPVAARSAIAEILNEKGVGRPRKVGFKWAPLDHDEIVRVDADDDLIILNSRFRKELAEGQGNDAPVLKVALMFLLQRELEKTFRTKAAASWLQRINQALIASLKGG